MSDPDKKQIEIKTIFHGFLHGMDIQERSEHRYNSFDYCHNYFADNRGTAAEPDKMQMSCMVLWSFLASWGMLRGSSQLLWKNPLVLKDVITAIDKHSQLFDVDIEDYDDDKILNAILEAANEFTNLLTFEETNEETKKTKEVKPTVTLITKILLGVYACTPAFDINVSKGIKKNLPVKKLNARILKEFKKKWDDELKIVIGQEKIFTLDFNANPPKETSRTYKKIKLMDMFYFQMGMDIQKKRNALNPQT